MELKSLVIRTSDTQILADFYSLLGLTFACHRRGSSPAHYSATVGNTVLEIYPLAQQQNKADKNLRLGFSIENFDTVIKSLQDIPVEFSMDPMQTENGFMAVIADPDGRQIELYRN